MTAVVVDHTAASFLVGIGVVEILDRLFVVAVVAAALVLASFRYSFD